MSWLLSLWHAYTRRLDRLMLWPVVRDKCPGDLAKARGAFLLHMELDRAYDRMGYDEKQSYLRGLK